MNGIVILGCAASFRSGSPHISSVTVLHLTLMVLLTCGSLAINTVVRGQIPGDEKERRAFS